MNVMNLKIRGGRFIYIEEARLSIMKPGPKAYSPREASNRPWSEKKVFTDGLTS